MLNNHASHSARSAWIETLKIKESLFKAACRTPQGVRGLKPVPLKISSGGKGSHSARSAWIETRRSKIISIIIAVALRKECVD